MSHSHSHLQKEHTATQPDTHSNPAGQDLVQTTNNRLPSSSGHCLLAASAQKIHAKEERRRRALHCCSSLTLIKALPQSISVTSCPSTSAAASAGSSHTRSSFTSCLVPAAAHFLWRGISTTSRLLGAPDTTKSGTGPQQADIELHNTMPTPPKQPTKRPTDAAAVSSQHRPFPDLSKNPKGRADIHENVQYRAAQYLASDPVSHAGSQR